MRQSDFCKLRNKSSFKPFDARRAAVACAVLIGTSPSAMAEDSDLAQQLANPIAAIISVPFQLNYDQNLGPDGDGTRTTLNFQPVIPFELDNGANIVTRSIFPYIWQDDVVSGTSQQGFGDISLNAWYSRTTESGLTWGIGPTVLVPTGSEVSGDTWGAGVTGIALKTSGPWTFGGLASQTWDIESNPTTPINSTFIQPFLSYNTPEAITLSVTSESTYDWEADEWTAPLNFTVAKLGTVGNVKVNWQGGVGYWLDSPEDGPNGWRFRLNATLVFPAK